MQGGGSEPLVLNYHSASSGLIDTLTSQVEVDSLYQDQNNLQDYAFKLIGEMNHGCDCEWDLAKPILSGVDKFKRYIIKKVENDATNRTKL